MCVACGHKYPGSTQRTVRVPQPSGRYRIKPLSRPTAQQPVQKPAQPVAPVSQVVTTSVNKGD